jgi:hypothetical protein
MKPSKVSNSTKTGLNNSELDEFTNIEPKRMMIRMTNEIKEGMYKTSTN